MTIANFVAILIAAYMQSVDPSVTFEGPRTEDEKKAAAIAEQYIVAHFKDYDMRMAWKLIIEDRGKYWKVFYLLPPGYLGGSPAAHIEKGTFAVLDSYQER